ncbi:MAG: DUF2780 domain-containing protein [Candidatus Thiodiazotropha sp.]
MARLFRAFTLCLLIFNPSTAFADGLLNTLTSQLGITSEQASGGAGALFNLAQGNLSHSKPMIQNDCWQPIHWLSKLGNQASFHKGW